MFRNPQVWLALLMTTFGFAGVFASFTYIAPMMTSVAGFSPGAVTWLLVLFGAGLFAGNLLGGKAADRAVMPSLMIILVGLAVVLTAFVFTAQSTRFSRRSPSCCSAPSGSRRCRPLQMRVMQTASGAPALASAANIAAFNLGNAGGAWLGGLAIERGLGYTAPNWIGALLAVAGLVVAGVSIALERRVSSRTGQNASEARQNDRKMVSVAN